MKMGLQQSEGGLSDSQYEIMKKRLENDSGLRKEYGCGHARGNYVSKYTSERDRNLPEKTDSKKGLHGKGYPGTAAFIMSTADLSVV